jgi:hypothetical protein
MTYRLNNHVGRYVIYLKFDIKGQLSTRLYDKRDDINSAKLYSPIVSDDEFVYYLNLYQSKDQRCSF